MKNIATLLILLFFSTAVFSQQRDPTPGTQPRANQQIQVEDANWFARNNLGLPRFADTAQANTFTKMDTCGRFIYTYDINGLWYRACSPKRWVTLPQQGIIINGDTVTYLMDVSRPGGQLNVYGKYYNPLTKSTYQRIMFVDSIGTGGGPSTDSVNAIGVKSIAQLRTVTYQDITAFKKSPTDKPFINLLGYYAPNDLGGGRFYFDDTCTHADDTIYYVKPTSVSGAGRWVRIINNQAIMPEMAGAKGDGSTDDIGAFRRIVNWFKLNPNKGVTDLLLNPKTYYMSDSLSIDVSIRIRGLLTYAGETAKLFFPYPTKGVDIPFPNTVFASSFMIYSNGSSSTDSTQYGLKIHSVVYMDHVQVESFAGTGIEISGDGGAMPISNTDRSYFEGCQSRLNGIYGWKIFGGDANIIVFNNCEAVSNGAAGFYDQGFLGNTYINTHTASNSSPELTWQKCLVKSGGVVYSALRNGFLGRPDLDPTSWVRIPADRQYWIIFAPVQTFDSTKFYRLGGGYNLDEANTLGHNQFATLIGCYAEQDQPLSYWSEKTIAVGGNAAVFVRQGAAILGYNGQVFANQDVFVTNNYAGDTLNSVVTSRGLQVANKVNATNGYMLGWNENTKVGYFRDNGYSISDPNSSAWSGIYIVTPQTDPSLAGRVHWGGNFVGGSLMTHSHYLLNIGSTYPTYNYVGIADVAPTTGDWTAGDIVLYSGTDTTIAYFRCQVTGSPGTWKTIKSGNVAASASITINSTGILSGTAGRILYENSSNKVDETANLSYDAGNATFLVGSISSPGSSFGLAVQKSIAVGVTNQFGLGGDVSALGELGAGARMTTNPGSNIQIAPGFNGSINASDKVYFGYFNGSAFYSALEYGNVASGFATMTVLKSGGQFVLGGSFAVPYVAKTGTYAVTSSDNIIDCTSGTFTVTLPTAVGCAGRYYTVKNSGSGAITVATTSSQTIDGSTTYTLASQYKYVTVVSNGANFIVIANN